ncbi:amidase [Streptomyces sp. NPDC086091]|uniref:amidase n=1 Tax=Streptomyces sp. NPDC086091 TaxID=3365751 RepID=UPI00383091FF
MRAAESVTDATVTEIQLALTEGVTTRREVVEHHLARIAAHNGVVNGFVELRADEVLAEAEAADAAHGRRIAGPLDGVPFSVKDSYSVAGLRRTDGLPVNKDNVDAVDELTVRRLRDAGALVLGHAAIPDLCIRWNTVSGLYGTTVNPRDVTRSAGGSSGGDAANVAAGFATVGIGGDLGGSIRVPASFCGVYGFRPGAGRVAEYNPNVAEPEGVSHELMCEIGPLARSVTDIETTYDVIRGHHPRDPASIPGPARPVGERPPVALLRHETGAVLDPAIEHSLDETAELLRAEGYTVEEHVLPDLRRAPDVWAQIIGTELIRDYLPVIGEHVIDSERVHIEEMFGAYEVGGDVRAYLAAWRERRALQGVLLEAMEKHPLVLAPVAGMPAPPLDFDSFIGREASVALLDRMRCVPWVNLFSLPGLALPNGIQIVGRRFAEPEVLAAGHAAERRLPRVAVADL